MLDLWTLDVFCILLILFWGKNLKLYMLLTLDRKMTSTSHRFLKTLLELYSIDKIIMTVYFLINLFSLESITALQSYKCFFFSFCKFSVTLWLCEMSVATMLIEYITNFWVFGMIPLGIELSQRWPVLYH